MLLTSDSYFLSRITRQLVPIKSYTVTFNGFACMLNLYSVNGQYFNAGIVDTTNDITHYIKTKAEWQQIYPELFV